MLGGCIGCGDERLCLRHFELPQQIGDVGAKDGVVRVEHRQQHAVDEWMHRGDARGQCGAAIAIGFLGECFERCSRGFGTGGGQVVLREEAGFRRRVGELPDERGDALRIVRDGRGDGHAGIGERGAFRGQLFRMRQFEHAAGAELVDEFLPLGVG